MRFSVRLTALAIWSTVLCAQSAAFGQDQSEMEVYPISLTADHAQQWTDGADEILLLRGNCRIEQRETAYSSRRMVVWKRSIRVADRNPLGRKVESYRVYLEEDVQADQPGNTSNHNSYFVELNTTSGGEVHIGNTLKVPGDQDPLYERALKRQRLESRSRLSQTQYFVEQIAQEQPGSPGPQLVPFGNQPSQDQFRRIRVFPRSSRLFVESFESDTTTPPEQVWVIKGGVNLLVDGIEEFGVVDLSADRMIIWTIAGSSSELRSESLQPRDAPFQVYLEGNIVIRQGQNVLRASHAFYDAREDRALLLNAELKSYVPSLQGDLRVRGQRIRQLSSKNFHAQNAWATASKFGKPGYKLEASDVFLDYRYNNSTFGGQPQPSGFDPATGAPIYEETPWITSLNNRFSVEDIPVFYLPQVSSPAEDPNVPLRSASIGNDNIFGFQLRSTWDIPKLAGFEPPRGTEWLLDVDYLSKRGPAVGSRGRYGGTGLFGIPGVYRGDGNVYYINDGGTDDLGADRRALNPPNKNRGRVSFEHRHELPNEMLLFGEIGYVADRNFLEQYYENEFDREKQQETLLYLKQDLGNWSWSALGRAQVNDYEVNTAWLPKLDLHGFSEPVLGGMFNWSSHSSAGLARLYQADSPTDPNDLFVPVPYVTNARGGVLMTRHELDMPFNLGPLQMDPYVMGEAAFWNEDFNQNQIDRFVGRAGLRGSLTMWRVFPYMRNRILNLNGLTHKIVLKGDYSYTDASRDFSTIPQYNEFDDDSQERFRERLVTNTYGGVLPGNVEPRFYHIRDGSGSWVSVPYHELVNDQQVLRLSARQRLQTKVGPPDRQRIVDWMTLDVGASYFPEAERDNFSEDFGLLYGRYEWNVGSRTRFLASALYDVFEGGQEMWNVGVLSQRSSRGSLYVGLRQNRTGAFDSQILTASYTYQMGPKWVSTFGTAYDVAENMNRGQSLTITRVGADFLVHVAANYDQSKDNTGFAIAIEPRFGPFSGTATQLSSLLGIQ